MRNEVNQRTDAAVWTLEQEAIQNHRLLLGRVTKAETDIVLVAREHGRQALAEDDAKAEAIAVEAKVEGQARELDWGVLSVGSCSSGC